MPYRNFATQEELDARYYLENALANISLYIARRRARRSGRGWKHRLEVPLVPTLTEHLDLYPAPGLEHPAPVLVYSLGGYWWSQTSKAFGFVARGPTSRAWRPSWSTTPSVPR